MRKLFKKLFNLDKVEVLQIENLELRKQLGHITKQYEILKHQRDALNKKVVLLGGELQSLKIHHWKPVKNIKKGETYWVVTQGGYYPIKGSTLLFGMVSEATRRAYRNGFVVQTREEAEALQDALKNLVK